MNIIFHYIVLPILMFGGVVVVAGKFKYASFMHIFIASYWLLIYLGSITVMRNGFGNDMYLYSVWSVPFLVLLGFAFVQIAAWHGASKIRSKFHSSHITDLDEKVINKLVYVSYLMFLVPVIYLIDKGTSNVAFFFLLENRGSFVDTLVMRVSGMESNITPLLTYIYSYTYLLLYPLYISILTAYRSAGRISKLHYITVFISAAFFSVLTSEKAGLAFVVIAAALSYYYTSAARLIDFKTKLKFVSICIAALVLPALLYPLLFGFSSLDEFMLLTVENLWRRVVEVPTQAAAIYFEAFPAYFDFLGVKSNRFLSLIFADGEVTGAAVLVNDHFLGNWLRGGLVNAAFFASMYADWGMAGMWLSALIVGCIMAIIQVFYDRKDDLLASGFKAATVVAIIQLMITNVYSVSLGRGMVSIPIMYLIIRKILK